MRREDLSLSGRVLTWYLVVVMSLFAALPTQALAGFLPSASVVALADPDSVTDLKTIQTVLEMKVVQERLQDFGLTLEEVNQRVQQLSPQQIHQVATHLDELQPGGDSGLGILVSLLVIAILVVVLIQLSGHRVVVR